MKIVKQFDYIKQIHGFYVDKETNNVYFDIIIDFDAKDQEKIKEEIISNLKEKYPEYNFIIILDADISD